MNRSQYAAMMEDLMRMSMANDIYRPLETGMKTERLEQEIRQLKDQVVYLEDILRRERRINERLRSGHDMSRINLTDLIKLCHPDRHNNSLLANAITQELIILRKRGNEKA